MKTAAFLFPFLYRVLSSLEFYISLRPLFRIEQSFFISTPCVYVRTPRRYITLHSAYLLLSLPFLLSG